MPRTKRRTVKSSSNGLNTTAANATLANQPKSIKEILDEFDLEKLNINNHYNQLTDYYTNLIETSFLMVKMNLADSLQKNLYEYLAECNLKESNAPTTTQKAERPSRTLTRTAGKTARLNSVVATSTTCSAVKKRKVSKSEDRAFMTERNESPKFKTPINRPPPVSSVTPKVNMSEPMSVLRRPNQGEIALSMTGSPLMVSSVARDDMATISVPLANGNIMSILPRLGAADTFSMDVSFDEQTKQQLYALKGNIESILRIKPT